MTNVGLALLQNVDLEGVAKPIQGLNSIISVINDPNSLDYVHNNASAKRKPDTVLLRASSVQNLCTVGQGQSIEWENVAAGQCLDPLDIDRLTVLLAIASGKRRKTKSLDWRDVLYSCGHKKSVRDPASSPLIEQKSALNSGESRIGLGILPPGRSGKFPAILPRVKSDTLRLEPKKRALEQEGSDSRPSPFFHKWSTQVLTPLQGTTSPRSWTPLLRPGNHCPALTARQRLRALRNYQSQTRANPT